jgi:hypothetical protein
MFNNNFGSQKLLNAHKINTFYLQTRSRAVATLSSKGSQPKKEVIFDLLLFFPTFRKPYWH